MIAPHRRSYRECFSQYLLTQPLRQVTGRPKVHSYTQEVLEGDLKSAQVKERGAGYRIDKNVQVAVLSVPSVQDRPKDTRIPGPALLDQAANFVPVKVQSFGWLHEST